LLETKRVDSWRLSSTRSECFTPTRIGGRRSRLKRTWFLEGQIEHQHPLTTEARAQRFQESWIFLEDPPLVLFGELRHQLMEVDPALLQHSRLPQSRAGNDPSQMQRTLNLFLRRHLLTVEPLNQSSDRAAQQSGETRSSLRAFVTIWSFRRSLSAAPPSWPEYEHEMLGQQTFHTLPSSVYRHAHAPHAGAALCTGT
jgi:hypothetical protein